MRSTCGSAYCETSLKDGPLGQDEDSVLRNHDLLQAVPLLLLDKIRHIGHHVNVTSCVPQSSSVTVLILFPIPIPFLQIIHYCLYSATEEGATQVYSGYLVILSITTIFFLLGLASLVHIPFHICTFGEFHWEVLNCSLTSLWYTDSYSLDLEHLNVKRKETKVGSDRSWLIPVGGQKRQHEVLQLRVLKFSSSPGPLFQPFY